MHLTLLDLRNTAHAIRNAQGCFVIIDKGTCQRAVPVENGTVTYTGQFVSSREGVVGCVATLQPFVVVWEDNCVTNIARPSQLCLMAADDAKTLKLQAWLKKVPIFLLRLTLLSLDENSDKIPTIRNLRNDYKEATGEIMGLREAKELVDWMTEERKTLSLPGVMDSILNIKGEK